MFNTDDSEGQALTVRELRELLKGLSGDTVIVCEDGNFHQALIFEGKVATHAGFGTEVRRTFQSGDDAERNRIVNGDKDTVFLELKIPVLVLSICGTLKPPKNEK